MQNIKHVVFGSCAVGCIARAYSAMKNAGELDNGVKMVPWSMTRNVFHNLFFKFSDKNCCVFYFPDLAAYNDTLPKDMLDPDQKTDAWKDLKSNLRIPLDEDVNKDYLYWYGSPVFPDHFFTRIHNWMSDQKAFVSENLIKDCVMFNMQYELELLKGLRDRNIRLIVVEGPPPLPHKTDSKAFKKTIGLCRSVVRDEMRKLHIPFLSLPDDMLDENSFTKEKFRRSPNDSSHPNLEFGKLRIQQMIKAAPQLLDEYKESRKVPVAPVHDSQEIDDFVNASRLNAAEKRCQALEARCAELMADVVRISSNRNEIQKRLNALEKECSQ